MASIAGCHCKNLMIFYCLLDGAHTKRGVPFFQLFFYHPFILLNIYGY